MKKLAGMLPLAALLAVLLAWTAPAETTSAETMTTTTTTTAASVDPDDATTQTEYTDNSPEQKLYDNAALFDADDTVTLQAQIDVFIAAYGMDMVIVTTNSTGDQNEREYAEAFYKDNGFGYGSDTSGVILLIDMGKRKYWIATDGRLRNSVTDDVVNGVIIPAMQNDMSAGDYAGAAMVFISEVRYYLDYPSPSPDYEYTDYYPHDNNNNNGYHQPSLEWNLTTSLVAAIAGGFILSLIIVIVMYTRHNRSMKAPSGGQYLKRPLRLSLHVDQFHSTHTSRTRRADDTHNHHHGGGGGGGFSGGGSSGGGGSMGGGGGSF